MIPLANYLHLPEAQQNLREQCAAILAQSLAQQIQICRQNKLTSQEIVENIFSRPPRYSEAPTI